MDAKSNGNIRIGVYVCHCGSNIAGKVRVEEVAEFAKKNGFNVVVAKDYKYMCSDPGQELIRKDIKEFNLNRIVVASCSPLMHENTFRRATEEGGLNPFYFQMANIREQCSWVTEDEEDATEKAKALVLAAIRRIAYHQPLEKKKVKINPNVLIVGAGIAGIQAALDIAEAGNKVYLVEKEAYIGGHMSKFDKTFPTLDCAACILTPKTVSISQNKNIELMTLSTIKEVDGYVGNFKVKIEKKARYVDLDNCTACGDCEKVCPIVRKNTFFEEMTERKAIYKPFPQAVPNAYLIEKRGIAACKNACPISQDVQGYVALIAQGRIKEAIQLIRKTNPFPAICGRICVHPCEGQCKRGEVDEPIAIQYLKRFAAEYELQHPEEIEIEKLGEPQDEKIAVVGAGPAGLTVAYDLARMGYKVTVFEKEAKPGGILTYGVPDHRLPKDVVEMELELIKKAGVEIITNSPVTDFDELKKKGYKAIFLGIGCWRTQKMNVPGEDLAGVLSGLEFLIDVAKGNPPRLGNRVVVVGGGNVAMDSARTAIRLGAKEVFILYRRSRVEMPASAEEIEEAEAEGIKFMYLSAPVKILPKDGKTVGAIECTKMELGPPDDTGRRRPIPIQGSEFKLECDNVISAIGQVPATDFIRGKLELTSWSTIKVNPITLETSAPGIFAGGDIVSGPASVVEAIAAGHRAAESIHRFLRGLDMEEGRTLTGTEKKIAQPDDLDKVEKRKRTKIIQKDPKERIKNFDEVNLGYTQELAVQEALRCLECGICSECLECVKACQRKAINHDMMDEIVEIEVGSIILATGFKLMNPLELREYGYGKYSNVFTSLEFEILNNASGPTGGKILTRDGRVPKSIGIIHCVGSRDKKYHEYCSRVCCMYALKFAHLIKEKIHDCEVYNFYIDMRCFGKGYEEFYNRLLKEGVNFIRGKIAEISDAALDPSEEGKLILRAEDTMIGVVRRVPVDMVILCLAIESQPDAKELSRLFTCSLGRDGFFIEKHPKLAPVSTAADGIFIAGACQSPKDIPDTVAQAGAAASQVLSLIQKGEVETEAVTATIVQELCSGCQICIPLCPYNAISYIKEENRAEINEALCKGCGTCVAACPSGASYQKHFTDQQIFAEIEGILSI